MGPEPPALTQFSPGRVNAGLVGCVHVLLSEGSMGPCDEDRICKLTEPNAPNVGPLWLYGAPQQTSGTVRCR